MDEKPNLNENKTDLALALTKGALGAVPYVGGILAEILGILIPQQRSDRLVEFMTILAKQVANLDHEVLEQRMKSAEWLDLLEDAMWQAARALTPERKEKLLRCSGTAYTRESSITCNRRSCYRYSMS